MTNMSEGSAANDDVGSQARFVAAAQRNKPMAWKRVELLRAVCAIPPTLSLEQSAATISLAILGPPTALDSRGEGRAGRSACC